MKEVKRMNEYEHERLRTCAHVRQKKEAKQINNAHEIYKRHTLTRSLTAEQGAIDLTFKLKQLNQTLCDNSNTSHRSQASFA